LATQEQQTANEMTAEGADLAARRNMMAANGSLRAWYRTALSMITLWERVRT